MKEARHGPRNDAGDWRKAFSRRCSTTFQAPPVRPMISCTLSPCAIGLLLILAMSGCATTTFREYEGAQRPRSEVGVILPGGGFGETTCKFVTVVRMIDGQATRYPKPGTPEQPYATSAPAIEVPSGEHEFVLDCYFVQGQGAGTRVGNLRYTGAYRVITLIDSAQAARFTIMAGHKYQVRYRFRGTLGWGTTTLRSLEITDVATREIVFQKNIEGKPVPWL